MMGTKKGLRAACSEPIDDLRRQAERVFAGRPPEPPDSTSGTSPEELHRLIHELQVHQIELEIQNEELRRVQLELDASLSRYFDLYELAPVGYCTLSEQGLILKANLTLATQLGSPRGQLLAQRFSAFIIRKDQDIFYRHRPKSRETTATVAFELRMVPKQGPLFWARIELRVLPAANGPLEYLLAVSDITPLKQLEESLRDLARFPSENLNPILRISQDGHLLYANEGALKHLVEWPLLIGEPVPAELSETVERVLRKGSPCKLASSHRGTDWLCFVTPVPEASYANLFCIDVTERRRREDSLLKLNRSLEDQQQAQSTLLERLSARLLTAQDDERKRIALDLHDSLGQTLSALRLMGGRVVGGSGPAGTGGHLACTPAMMTILSGAIEEVRRISMDLRPSMLDDLGILPTLNWFLRNFKTSHPTIQVNKRIRVAEGAIPEALKITLFRIVQEAFHNATQHGHASEIALSLSLARGTLSLSLSDNGKGFDPTAQDRASGGGGLGLSSMRERAECSGGTFEVLSSPGKGTQLMAAWPLSFGAPLLGPAEFGPPSGTAKPPGPRTPPSARTAPQRRAR